MTVRVLGVLLIGAASLYTGGALTAIWQRRVEQLSAFCKLLGALEDGIGVMGLPVQSIVCQFSDAVLETAGFLPAVRAAYASDVGINALGEAFVQCMPALSVEDEERGLLSQFFAELGAEDRKRETQRCAYVHARLTSLRDAAAGALPARCKIARTLSGAVGCAAALMLL